MVIELGWAVVKVDRVHGLYKAGDRGITRLGIMSPVLLEDGLFVPAESAAVFLNMEQIDQVIAALQECKPLQGGGSND